jgi:hypothetical protein
VIPARDRPLTGWRVFLSALFLTSLLTVWTWRDGPLVDDNPLLFSAQADTPEKRALLVAPHAQTYWRPIAKLTLVPAAYFAGYATWPHRVVNALLHALATTLLWLTLRRYGEDRAATWAALVFVLHPLHAGALHWISARYDLVATVLVLSTMLAAHMRSGVWRSAWCGLLTALACLSKEVAFVTPALLALGWLGARPATSAPHRTRFAGPVGASLAGVVGVLAARWIVMQRLGGPDVLANPDPGVTLRNLLAYVPWTMLNPLNARAIPELTEPVGLLFMAIAPVALYGWWHAQRDRSLGFALLFMLVATLPAASFLYLDDTRNAAYMLYLPSAGFAWFLGTLLSKPKREWPLVAAVSLLYAAGLTINLSAYHAASRTMQRIVDRTRVATASVPATTVILEALPQEASGVRLFFDHVDQFFLPDPKLRATHVLFAGANFWRTEGRALPWRDTAWRAGVHVLRWEHGALADYTAATIDGWSRRADADRTCRLSLAKFEADGVTPADPNLTWRNRLIARPLTADGPDCTDAAAATLTFALRPRDLRAAGEAELVWRDDDGREQTALFEVRTDGMLYEYTLALAVDPRWARTSQPRDVQLRLPFRDGQILFVDY